MVGIVLVSHSRALALSVQELIRSMTGPDLPLAIAAGVGDDHRELGTDAVEIAEAIVSVRGKDGVLVLMDMGSAILSSETALDLLDEPLRANIRFCAAPFVEGSIAAGVTANLGAPLDEACSEALAALRQKEAALSSNPGANNFKPTPENKIDSDSSSTLCRKTRLTIRNAHGLHARPAARLIGETRSFRSNITVRNLSNQRGPVSVRSLSSLAGLEILHDHEIEVEARGDDAQAALGRIIQLVDSGLGDDLSATNGAVPPHPIQSISQQPAIPSAAVPIGGGIVMGVGTFFEDARLNIPQDRTDDVDAELDRLQSAVAATQNALAHRCEEMNARVGTANAAIYQAQILTLQDPELVDNAMRIIRDQRVNAALAWDRANRQIVDRYESLHDPYLRERAADLSDVGRQVLELLAPGKSEAPMLVEPGILIANNLTPYQVSTLNPKLTRGVILLDGGPTAHSSILLKALGIPALVQARSVLSGSDLSQPNRIAFDGSSGKIWLNPDADFLVELQNRQIEDRKCAEDEAAASLQSASTRDGYAVEIFANIGDVSEVEAALSLGAEGVGLLRTEFLFLERHSAPSEDEQREALLAIAEKMKGKPLVVRTLDVGGDKELSYLARVAEENPFLGVRAIRLCFSHEQLFTTQLRAILRAGECHDFRIMFPMIAHVADFDRALACLEKVHYDLEQENVPHLWPVQTGLMIEIPSAALQAESLAERADFFSIGTNDLTQYTLAADRGNPALASYQDALHPSVLRLIEIVVAGARKYGRLVAVCGEAASDERSASIFVGLGVQELSLTGARIPHLKACLRRQSLDDLQRLAHTALRCVSAADVRALPLN